MSLQHTKKLKSIFRPVALKKCWFLSARFFHACTPRIFASFVILDKEYSGLKSWLRSHQDLVEKQHSVFVSTMKSECYELLISFSKL